MSASSPPRVNRYRARFSPLLSLIVGGVDQKRAVGYLGASYSAIKGLDDRLFILGIDRAYRAF